MSGNQGDASYRDTLESIRKCFDGLCLYAAREAALGRDASNIRSFALDMAAFWGLDNQADGDRYETDFDRAVSEAKESGQAPEMTERDKSDVIRGLDSYAKELECVGGRDGFYRRCDSFLDGLKSEWGMGDADFLIRRLDECLLKRYDGVGRNPGLGSLHTLGYFIAMHEYLTGEHCFSEEEVSRLLRFEDPLEVAAECAEIGNTLHDINLQFYMERANPEESFPMVNGAASLDASRKTPRKDRTAARKKERETAAK